MTTEQIIISAILGLALVFFMWGRSAFMSNVGALALRLSERPSAVLMPLSFATILGGLVTLIGTPPNIIIATYRADVTSEAFAMFDFAFVGLPIAVIGLVFVLLIGCRLIPRDRASQCTAEEMFELDSYIVEASLNDDSEYVGRKVHELEELDEEQSIVVGLMRDETRRLIANHERVSARWEHPASARRSGNDRRSSQEGRADPDRQRPPQYGEYSLGPGRHCRGGCAARCASGSRGRHPAARSPRAI